MDWINKLFIWILMQTCLKVEAQQTCDTIYTRDGMEPILPFRLQVPSSGVQTYQVAHLSSLTTLFEVAYINGIVNNPTIYSWYEYGPDVDLATGKLDLKLLQVTSNRTGRYKLTNVQTSQLVQCIDVVLLGTPTKTGITASAVPYVGENLVLTCSSSHTTVPANGLTMEYTWIVDTVTNPSDVRYVYSSNRGTLTINSVVKADAQKQITCRAREAVSGGLTSADSDVYTVIVLYGPDDFALNPSQLAHTVAEGNPTPSITCSADCYPGCIYVWTKNSSPTASSSGTLSLGTAGRTDSGNYRCTATNSNRTEHTSTSSIVVVTVQYGPENIRFLPQPNVTEVNESQSLLKQCLADCVPACSYVWMKGSTSISTTKNLTFQSVRSNDAGVYTCTASNPAMQTPTLSKTFTLNVIYGPRSIQLTPTTTSYREDIGTNIPSIRCGSSCWPCIYTWTGPGSFTPSGAELNLPPLTKGHHGDYTCTVKNSRTQVLVTATITVEVKYTDKPEVNISGETLMGGSTDVICKAKGYPTTFNYTSFVHTLNGKTIRNSSASIGSRDIARFGISSLKLEDTGTYTCSVNNGVNDREGILTQTSSVQLMVKGRPAVSHLNKKVVAGETTKDVTMVVMYYSYPPMIKEPEILHNSAPLQATDKISSLVEPSNVTFFFYGTEVELSGNAVSLTITSLQEEDFGNYTFILDNGVAGSPNEYIVELKPDRRPDPPTDFSVADGSISETTVSLMWVKGFNGGLPQTFVIQYRKSVVNTWSDIRIHETEDNIMSKQLRNLESDTQYTVRIYSYNLNGKSEGSTNVTFSTLKGIEECGGSTNATVVGAGVGVASAVVVIILIIVIIVMSRRRFKRGGGSEQKNRHGSNIVNKDLNTIDTMSSYEPIGRSNTTGRLDVADDSSSEGKTPTYTSLAQYGNVQNTYASLGPAPATPGDGSKSTYDNLAVSEF